MDTAGADIVFDVDRDAVGTPPGAVGVNGAADTVTTGGAVPVAGVELWVPQPAVKTTAATPATAARLLDIDAPSTV